MSRFHSKDEIFRDGFECYALDPEGEEIEVDCDTGEVIDLISLDDDEDFRDMRDEDFYDD